MRKFSSQGWPAFSYEHFEIFTKEIGVRRDLGNRASPVNLAHMKRPLVMVRNGITSSETYSYETNYSIIAAR